MAEIRMKKDTKVIYDISFDSIKVAYNRQQGSLLNVEPVSERFEDFLMDSLLNADGYAAILHDPYRKVYYRYLLRGMPNATPKTPIDSKNLVVVMMDEQFRYLGETELGTGKEWNWTNSFVSPEGVNIEKIGTEVEDDDYLTFGIFSVRAIQE